MRNGRFVFRESGSHVFGVDGFFRCKQTRRTRERAAPEYDADVLRAAVNALRERLRKSWATIAGDATSAAVAYLQQLFAGGGDMVGPVLARRAEEIVGNPATVTAAATALADDLLQAIPGAS